MKNCMKTVIGAIALAALLAVPASAQINVVTMAQLTGSLGTACTAGNITYSLFQVRDAVSSVSCTTGGGDGTTPSICWCVDGSFASIGSSVVDLSGYVPVTKAGANSMAATGALGTITVSSDSGSGETSSLFIDTTSDGNALADLVANAATESTITVKAMNTADVGYAWVQVDGQPSDVSSFMLRAAPASGPADSSTVFGDPTTVIADAAGGADELVITDDSVAVGAAAAFYTAKASAPPVACAGGTAGAEYFDTDIAKKCICNGTNYVLANDDTTTTGCS